MVGIKETEDGIKLIEVIADAVLAAKANGVVSLLDDADEFLPVLRAGIEAARGSAGIAAELKELDGTEVSQLVEDTAKAVAKLVAAVMAA